MPLSTRLLGALALCVAASACSPQPQPAIPAAAPSAGVPRDTGNMAYPAPLPAGNVNTVRPR